MKTITSFINENKTTEKLEKLQAQLEKITTQFNKIITKYSGDTSVNQYIPVDIFNNFRKLSVDERKQLPNIFRDSYNPEAFDLYYKTNMPKDSKDTYYFDYYCRANDLFDRIVSKQNAIKDEQEKIERKAAKEFKIHSIEELGEKLMEKVPELKQFIDACAEKQYKYMVNYNEKLKLAWEKYYDAKRTANDYYNNTTDNDRNIKYSSMMDDVKQLRPTKQFKTNDQIKLEVEYWKKHEQQFLASRITTEFGEIKSTDLYQGDDYNVNGTIVGTLKTAKIETVWAGGYNIQCLHTRFLVHEK